MFETQKYYKRKIKQEKEREYIAALNERIKELEEENKLLRMKLETNEKLVAAADELTVEHTKLIREMNQMRTDYQRELNEVRRLFATTRKDINFMRDKQMGRMTKKEE